MEGSVKFSNMVLTGFRVRNLMRKHEVTIRDVKRKHQITLKRVREVRENGVRGFNAAEWFWIITGRWPDDPEPAPTSDSTDRSTRPSEARTDGRASFNQA